jgi:hypothetical protein
VIDGIPVTSLPRTLLDFAAVARPQQLRLALEAAQRRDLVYANTFDDILARTRGHHGISPLRQVLALLRDEAPWTDSELEREALALLREGGVPEPRTQALLLGERMDLYWPEPAPGLVIELDSYEWHKSRERFERDRRIDAKFQAARIPLLRLTKRRITRERMQVLREVAGLLSGGRRDAAA